MGATTTAAIIPMTRPSSSDFRFLFRFSFQASIDLSIPSWSSRTNEEFARSLGAKEFLDIAPVLSRSQEGSSTFRERTQARQNYSLPKSVL